jgi:hypothetical protein
MEDKVDFVRANDSHRSASMWDVMMMKKEVVAR